MLKTDTAVFPSLYFGTMRINRYVHLDAVNNFLWQSFINTIDTPPPMEAQDRSSHRPTELERNIVSMYIQPNNYIC